MKENVHVIAALVFLGSVFVVAVVLVLSGLVFLFLPRHVRRYDRRVTRYIKDEESYVAFVRMLGILFVMLAGCAVLILIWTSIAAR